MQASVRDPTDVGADFSQLVSIYAACGSLSLVLTLMITVAFFASPRIRREHSSILIQIITTVDLIYTLKYLVGAIAWGVGAQHTLYSFNFIDDKCLTATLYSQLSGMLCVSWNAMWALDFVLILRSPVKARGSQRKYYHLYVWIVVICLGAYVGTTFTPWTLSCWTREHTPFFEALLCIYLIGAGLSLLYAALLLKGGGPLRVVRTQLLKQHALFVVAFLVLWSWPLIHRAVDDSDENHTLTAIDAFVASGQAAIFSLVRLIDMRTRVVFFRLWWRILKYLTNPCRRACIRVVIVSHDTEPEVGSMRDLVKIDDSLPSDMPQAGSTEFGQSSDTVAEPLLRPSDVEAAGLYIPPVASQRRWVDKVIASVFPQEDVSQTSSSRAPRISLPVIRKTEEYVPPVAAVPVDTPISPSLPSSPGCGVHAYMARSPSPATGKFIPRRQFERSTPAAEVSESWDTTASLRTEIAACILSAVCQTVVENENSRDRFSANFPSSSTIFSELSRTDLMETASEATREATLNPVPEERVGSFAESIATELTNAFTLGTETTPPKPGRTARKTRVQKDHMPVVREMQMLEGDALMEKISHKSDGDAMSDPSLCLLRLCSQDNVDAGSGSRAAWHPSTAKSCISGFQCSSYGESVFASLRACARIRAEQVISSLNPALLRSKELKAQFTEGASSSFFCRSADSQLLVKTINQDELNTLMQMLPAYAYHLRTRPSSLICRIYCCISVNFSAFQKFYCVLMGNAFPIPDPERALPGWVQPNSQQVFDLKGSTINRSSATRGGGGSLLLDNDYRKLYPRGIAVFDADGISNTSIVPALVEQLTADAEFLKSQGIMDYSLLLNVVPLMPDICQRKAEEVLKAIRDFEAKLPSVEVGATSINIRHSLLSLCIGKLPSEPAAVVSREASMNSPTRLSVSENVISSPIASPAAAPDCAEAERPTVYLLQLGIIDLLQTFDYKKQAENKLKTLGSSLARSRPSYLEGGISAVDPDRYCARFADFMTRVLSHPELVRGPSGEAVLSP